MKTQFRLVDETGVGKKGVDETSNRRNRSRRNRYQSLC